MKFRVALLAGTSLIGCGVGHIEEYVPKTRAYQQPVEVKPAEARPADGSLVSGGASPLLTSIQDVTALAINDIVVIKIVETASAERSASTDTEREGGIDVSARLGGAVAVSEGLGADLGYNSQNSGRTSRTDDVRFTVAATVKQKFPNGNLFVEGHRVVLVNGEEHHYYVSGVARPADIDATNAIRSDRLADAEIELTGRGIVTAAQEPGWFTKFINWISIF